MNLASLRVFLIAGSCFAASVSAQVANDECINATVLTLGNNPYQNTTGATPSPVTWPAGTPENDIWMRYVADCTGTVRLNICTGASAAVSTQVFTGTCGALTPVAATYVYCGPYYGIFTPTWTATAGTTYFIRAYDDQFSFPGVFVPRLSCDPGIALRGVAEPTVGSGVLAPSGGAFHGGDYLRWNYLDQSGLHGTSFAVTALNIGIGGSPAIGVTAGLPGLRQLWPGSSPAGSELIFGPFGVAGADYSLQIPPGLFTNGDTVRVQGIILDVNSPNPLPVVPTSNTIEWVYGLDCIHFEGFEGIPTGFGQVPVGWASLALQPWGAISGSSPEGSQHLACPTSLVSQNPGMFELVSPVFASAGVSLLEFQLGRLGPNVELLTVYVGDGANFPTTPLATYGGIGSSGAAWTLERLPLTNLGPNVQFRFQYRSRGSQGDIGIDAFCLR